MLVDVHQSDEYGNVFTLRERLEIRWNGKWLIVPVGFKSDGASVPRFFWRIVFPPGDNRAMRAAFAHDYIYRHHPMKECWTKAEADQMFYDLLIVDGIPKLNAKLAYWGVKLFGGSAWRKRGAS
ncbi:MAG: DUF1353 domain-containing protein [Lentisphaeria bacterium]|nr:DUF1353 domain-containing protein [Lentisphaeria bacterium]